MSTLHRKLLRIADASSGFRACTELVTLHEAWRTALRQEFETRRTYLQLAKLAKKFKGNWQPPTGLPSADQVEALQDEYDSLRLTIREYELAADKREAHVRELARALQSVRLPVRRILLRVQAKNGDDGISPLRDDICVVCGFHEVDGGKVARINEGGFGQCSRCLRILIPEAVMEEALHEMGPDPATEIIWEEVLPPGSWRDTAAGDPAWSGAGPLGKATLDGVSGQSDPYRLQVISALGPKRRYEGSHMGHRWYDVFEFPDVTIAECLQLGNALYFTTHEDWRSVFRVCKKDALERGAERITHSGDWESRVRSIITNPPTPSLGSPRCA